MSILPIILAVTRSYQQSVWNNNNGKDRRKATLVSRRRTLAVVSSVMFSNYGIFVYFYGIFCMVFFCIFHGAYFFNSIYITPPPPLRSSHIYMRDAHCAESNEISIFRFLITDTLGFSSVHITDQKNRPKEAKCTKKKDAQWAEPNEKSIFRFLFFELWSILFNIFKCITD